MQHSTSVPAYVDQLTSAALGGTLSRRAAYLVAQGGRRRAIRAAAAVRSVGVLPALAGERWPSYDGRYRVYTIAHLPFDALPAYGDGGPAKVAVGGWGVSTSSLSRAFSSPSVVAADDGMYTLRASRMVGPDGGVVERHALDGTKYATARDADRTAFWAGLVGFMVYERDAARFGLPTVADVEAAGRACKPAELSEVRLSDCPAGCKVMVCATCGQEQVVHSRTYGCRQGDVVTRSRAAWTAATGRPMGSVQDVRTDDLHEMPEPGADLDALDGDDEADEHAQARAAWEAATGRPMGSVQDVRTDDLYEMPAPGADLDALDGDE